MKIMKPQSAFATLSDLVLTLSSIEQHPTTIVDKAFRQNLIQAVATLRDANKQLDQARNAKKLAASERLQKGKVMIKAIRDFYQVLKRSTERNPAAQVWQGVYGTEKNAPRSSTLTSQWYELARKIATAGVEVAARLAEDGGSFPVPPPTSPSAEEVAATLPSAEAADRLWRDKNEELKQAELAVIQARVQGKRLLTQMRARLMAAFHGLPPEQVRVKMRTYGVRYANDRQQEDPDDEPATTAAPLSPKAKKISA